MHVVKKSIQLLCLLLTCFWELCCCLIMWLRLWNSYSSVAATQPVIHSFFLFLLLTISSSNFIKSMGSKNTRNKKPKEMKQPLRFHELMLIGSWWKFNKVASGLCLLHTSLVFRTSVGCAFTCLFASTSQVCPLQTLSSCLMVCFISSVHCTRSNCCLCSNPQTTTPSTCLLCCAVLYRCLSLFFKGTGCLP